VSLLQECLHPLTSTKGSYGVLWGFKAYSLPIGTTEAPNSTGTYGNTVGFCGDLGEPKGYATRDSQRPLQALNCGNSR